MESWQIAGILQMLIGAIGGLGALGIISFTIIKRRPKISNADLAKLQESVDGVRDSVEGLRDEMGEVFDRLDFNERILSRIADGEQNKLPNESV